ncbi:MAG: hypothetical protein VB055_02110 [Oscillospiraceae bacterium]|nr:hypothetical protein [Oscillospiraceae bacterium]
MQNITPEYTYLFNVITDVTDNLLALRDRLIAAQQQAEEEYISREESAGGKEAE